MSDDDGDLTEVTNFKTSTGRNRFLKDILSVDASARRKRRAKFVRAFLGLIDTFGMPLDYAAGVINELASNPSQIERYMSGAAATTATTGGSGPAASRSSRMGEDDGAAHPPPAASFISPSASSGSIVTATSPLSGPRGIKRSRSALAAEGSMESEADGAGFGQSNSTGSAPTLQPLLLGGGAGSSGSFVFNTASARSTRLSSSASAPSLASLLPGGGASGGGSAPNSSGKPTADAVRRSQRQRAAAAAAANGHSGPASPMLAAGAGWSAPSGVSHSAGVSLVSSPAFGALAVGNAGSSGSGGGGHYANPSPLSGGGASGSSGGPHSMSYMSLTHAPSSASLLRLTLEEAMLGDEDEEEDDDGGDGLKTASGGSGGGTVVGAEHHHAHAHHHGLGMQLLQPEATGPSGPFMPSFPLSSAHSTSGLMPASGLSQPPSARLMAGHTPTSIPVFPGVSRGGLPFPSAFPSASPCAPAPAGFVPSVPAAFAFGGLPSSPFTSVTSSSAGSAAQPPPRSRSLSEAMESLGVAGSAGIAASPATAGALSGLSGGGMRGSGVFQPQHPLQPSPDAMFTLGVQDIL